MSAERTSCPACAKPVPEGAERCPNCSVLLSEHDSCVHCGANVDVEPAPLGRFVCRLCGGIRVPLDDAGIERSAALVEKLRGATVARTAFTVWRLVAVAGAAFGCVSVIVLSLVVGVAHPPLLASVVGAISAAVPFALAALAMQRARTRYGEIAGLVERAWFAAASEIARAKGGEIDAKGLAKITHITESEADALLGKMSTESLFASAVTAEGGLRYALLDASPPPEARALPAGQ